MPLSQDGDNGLQAPAGQILSRLQPHRSTLPHTNFDDPFARCANALDKFQAVSSMKRRRAFSADGPPQLNATFSYDFLGRPKPKNFSKNRPEVRILNHQYENRRDCMTLLPKGISSNGEALSVSKSKVERFFCAGTA
jgi:hypothetical protein